MLAKRLSHRPKKMGILIKVKKRPKIPCTARLPEMTEPPPPPCANSTNPLFTPPIKPAQVFQSFSNYITETEGAEIVQFREIYFLRLDPVSKNSPASKRLGTYFQFVKDDHIAFRYQQLDVLGKGSFGSVLKCMDHKTGNLVAVKMMRDQPKVHSQLVFELDLLKQLQSSEDHHIIRYVESFVFRGFFCIAMELVSDDLYTALKRRRFMGFRTPTVQMIVWETADALDYMHSKGIVHCDIKPENILFETEEQRHVKLIDFGCSCYVGKILFSYIQSRYYRAPEVVLGMQYSKQIDVWSVGCMVCELVTGRPLFPARSEDELMEMMVEMLGLPPLVMVRNAPRAHHYFDNNGKLKQKQGASDRVRVPNGTTISDATGIRDTGLLKLIEGCLKWHPAERLTARQIMEDPWCISATEEKMPQTFR